MVMYEHIVSIGYLDCSRLLDRALDVGAVQHLEHDALPACSCMSDMVKSSFRTVS